MKLPSRILSVLLVLISLAASGCRLTAQNTVIVVSDGITAITATPGAAAGEEILPNAIVYKKKDASDSLLKLLTADKVEDAAVAFLVRKPGHADWQMLKGRQGNFEATEANLFRTDEDGCVRLPGILDRLPEGFLSDLPLPATIALQARVYIGTEKEDFVEDSLGIIRILGNPEENPHVIAADHDNTVHATGGLNALSDWIDFLNAMKSDWPYVDDAVETVIPELVDGEGMDLILVTGMSPEVRYFCREQMMAHFEDRLEGDLRRIPIIVKKDLPFADSPEFKAETLKRLMAFYGNGKLKAMVGDTVRQDGFGALANGIQYIPFKVDPLPDFWLLNTEGYGWIAPDMVVDDWWEVAARIETPYAFSENAFLAPHPIRNIAHRGGGQLMPENTMAAYKNAIANGADILEADVHMTIDGHVVVSHDETVDRCTDGSGAIKEMDFATVRSLDASFRFVQDGGSIPEGTPVDDLVIPTLDELLALCASTHSPLILEIKQEGEAIVDRVLSRIRHYGMDDGLILGGFDQSTLDSIKEKTAANGPFGDLAIKTIFDQNAVLKFVATPTAIMARDGYTQPADVLCLPTYLMNQAMMAKIRLLGMKCYVWTVNSEIEMKRQKDWLGVDGIMTDNPARLTALMAKDAQP